jgi:type II secretory pathway pseudopilin PulG
MRIYALPSVMKKPASTRQAGFSYIEMLIAVTITGLIIAGLMGLVNTVTKTGEDVHQRNDLTRQARFAMQRMVRQLSHSPRLLLPLKDSPYTNWPENIREQTIPASPPIGSSTFATAVLAFSLPAYVDLDANGVADADNDGDGLIDEDWGADSNNDGYPGIYLIDDNGDGSIDVSAAGAPQNDDDEDDSSSEDRFNGIDDDGDGSVDEDGKSDMNDDGEAGVANIDDDNDGTIDEGNRNNDDEDVLVNEDWLDSVVFFLDGSDLKERMPVPWDANADSLLNGADFVESVIATGVTRFRVERLNDGARVELVDLTLELTSSDSSETISLQTRVRPGGAL